MGLKRLLACLLISSVAYAEQIGISSFCGLNNNENSLIIKDCQAQELQNVEITPGGKSVKKRSGFGQYKDIDEGALHGGHHFFDSVGNDVQVWGSSKSLTGIIADGSPTVLISSATLGSTWDCADIQGFAYCVNSNRDVYVRTNGATIAWQTSPLGTMAEATPDRMVVAGVAAAPSSLYVSAANSFLANGFTVGPLTTDAFVEPIAAPGSKLTHIRWGCGKLLWWKDKSFGYTQFEDQYNLENRIISDNIGTFDNTSAIDPGGNIWFRGHDGHVYRYDCSGLIKESIEITPNIQASGRRTSNSWEQTSQSDWNGGSGSPVGNISTFTVVGDVTPTTFTVTENSSASGWSSGSASNVTVHTSSISLTINNSGNVDNNSFEDAGAETILVSSFTRTENGGVTLQRTQVINPGTCGSLSPKAGSWALAANFVSTINQSQVWNILDSNSVAISTLTLDNSSQNCTWVSRTLSAGSHIGKRVKLKLTGSSNGVTDTLTGTNSFILGGDITIWHVNGLPSQGGVYWDFIENGSSTITSGQFTSQVFNTGAPFSFVYSSATWTVATSTPGFVLQKASSTNGPWTTVTNSTGVNVQTDRKFLRYISSFTVSGSEDARSYLSGVQVISKSSGPFYSAVKNAPNISAWSTFQANYQNNDGNVYFNIRRATQSFTTLSSTPSAFTTLTPGALVTASTGTYFQVIASFTITAATNTTPSLNDFTVNWFDGSASDQAYMHYFDNAVWTSVAFGVGVSSNTHIFRRDLINDAWTVYNFGAGGFLTQNNRLYFGDVSNGGNIFLFGSGTSDNGASISSYWKTKDYPGPDPFLENQYNQIDTIFARNANQTATIGYQLNNSTTTTSYSVPLSSSTFSLIRHKKLLPSGKIGGTINLKVSDDSSTSAWEWFGGRITFNPLPYRPTN